MWQYLYFQIKKRERCTNNKKKEGYDYRPNRPIPAAQVLPTKRTKPRKTLMYPTPPTHIALKIEVEKEGRMGGDEKNNTLCSKYSMFSISARIIRDIAPITAIQERGK
jgi:hypothetical protein